MNSPILHMLCLNSLNDLALDSDEDLVASTRMILYSIENCFGNSYNLILLINSVLYNISCKIDTSSARAHPHTYSNHTNYRKTTHKWNINQVLRKDIADFGDTLFRKSCRFGIKEDEQPEKSALAVHRYFTTLKHS